MDKATGIIRLLNDNKLFVMWSKGGEVECGLIEDSAADLIRPHLAPEKEKYMIAAALAHRACHSAEHDPQNGKLHGYCVVCGVPWPCETAKRFLFEPLPEAPK